MDAKSKVPPLQYGAYAATKVEPGARNHEIEPRVDKKQSATAGASAAPAVAEMKGAAADEDVDVFEEDGEDAPFTPTWCVTVQAHTFACVLAKNSSLPFFFKKKKRLGG